MLKSFLAPLQPQSCCCYFENGASDPYTLTHTGKMIYWEKVTKREIQRLINLRWDMCLCARCLMALSANSSLKNILIELAK